MGPSLANIIWSFLLLCTVSFYPKTALRPIQNFMSPGVSILIHQKVAILIKILHNSHSNWDQGTWGYEIQRLCSNCSGDMQLMPTVAWSTLPSLQTRTDGPLRFFLQLVALEDPLIPIGLCLVIARVWHLQKPLCPRQRENGSKGYKDKKQ